MLFLDDARTCLSAATDTRAKQPWQRPLPHLTLTFPFSQAGRRMLLSLHVYLSFNISPSQPDDAISYFGSVAPWQDASHIEVRHIRADGGLRTNALTSVGRTCLLVELGSVGKGRLFELDLVQLFTSLLLLWCGS